MSFTSMTDVQRQVRYGWDKEPWLGQGEIRHSDARHFALITEGLPGDSCRFAPRPSCIPSPDPLPFTSVSKSLELLRLADAGSPIWGRKFAPRPWGSFTPNKKFVRSEANPILSDFRDATHIPFSDRVIAYLDLLSDDNVKLIRNEATDEQVESARRVLTKLRDVMEAGK